MKENKKYMENKKTKNSKYNKNNKENNDNKLVALTKGPIFSYLITIIAFITYGILLTYTETTEKNLQLVVMVTTVVSVLIGAFISSRGFDSKGLLVGMFIGIIYAVIMIMIALCLLPVLKVTSKMIMILVLSIASGGIGGIIGINSKKQH